MAAEATRDLWAPTRLFCAYSVTQHGRMNHERVVDVQPEANLDRRRANSLCSRAARSKWTPFSVV